MKTGDEKKNLLKIMGKGIVSTPIVMSLLFSPIGYVGYNMYQHHQEKLSDKAYVDSYDVDSKGLVIWSYDDGLSKEFRDIIDRYGVGNNNLGSYYGTFSLDDSSMVSLGTYTLSEDNVFGIDNGNKGDLGFFEGVDKENFTDNVGFGDEYKFPW